MNKSLAIKLVTVLVVVCVVYGVFWFFKVGQVEKQVNKFVSENASRVSIGEISVSGFPFSQKITIKELRFSLPNSALDKRQVVVKHLEAVSGMFSSEFSVILPEPVTVQDQEGVVANVEFNAAPEILVALDEGRIMKLSYKDSGYRIVEPEKNSVIYAASSTVVSVESAAGEEDKIISKITVDVKDIENFSVVDVYRNSFEKDIINSLKTGEIAIGSMASALIPAQLDPAGAVSNTTPQTDVAVTPAAPVAAPTAAPDANATIPATDMAAPAVASENTASAIVPSPIAEAAENMALKSNFVLNAEYVLAPIHVDQAMPTDPSQIQETPLQYTKTLKILDLRFSNALYSITVNGEMTVMADDSMPSGGLSVKVDNVDNLIKQVADGLNKIAEQSKPAPDLAADLIAQAPAEDSYTSFLKRISGGLNGVTKEIAAKNAVTKEAVAQFDIRREKNLDFLVNETPLREILGKF